MGYLESLIKMKRKIVKNFCNQMYKEGKSKKKIIYSLKKKRGRLLGGTVPPNNFLFGGTVPPNNFLFGGTYPAK